MMGLVGAYANSEIAAKFSQTSRLAVGQLGLFGSYLMKAEDSCEGGESCDG